MHTFAVLLVERHGAHLPYVSELQEEAPWACQADTAECMDHVAGLGFAHRVL